MTATAERITKNSQVLTDREIVKITTELFNDAVARYHDPDASEDTRNVIGALWRGFYEQFRPQVIDEIKPAVLESSEKAWEKAREVFEPRGRVTLNLRLVTSMTVVDGTNERTFTPDELVAAGYKHDRIYGESVFQHLEIADLYDGQVISLDLPHALTIMQERVVDTSRVALPDDWEQKATNVLKAALAALPTPIVEVENIVETPQVNVEINDAPSETTKIEFDRDRYGLIKSATTKQIDG